MFVTLRMEKTALGEQRGAKEVSGVVRLKMIWDEVVSRSGATRTLLYFGLARLTFFQVRRRKKTFLSTTPSSSQLSPFQARQAPQETPLLYKNHPPLVSLTSHPLSSDSTKKKLLLYKTVFFSFLTSFHTRRHKKKIFFSSTKPSFSLTSQPSKSGRRPSNTLPSSTKPPRSPHAPHTDRAQTHLTSHPSAETSSPQNPLSSQLTSHPLSSDSTTNNSSSPLQSPLFFYPPSAFQARQAPQPHPLLSSTKPSFRSRSPHTLLAQATGASTAPPGFRRPRRQGAGSAPGSASLDPGSWRGRG